MDVCRLCCKTLDKLLNIFEDDYYLSTRIMYCCNSLRIEEGDGLPVHICQSCEQDLDVVYNFVLRCEAADSKLRTELCTLLWGAQDETELKAKEKSDIGQKDFDLDVSQENYSDCSDDTQEVKIEIELHKNVTPKPRRYSERINTLKVADTEPKFIVAKGNENIKPKRPYTRKYKMRQKGPCKCSECGRIFANYSTLEKHLISHNKPFQCKLCDKKFKENVKLMRHMQRAHMKRSEWPRNLVCEHCGKSFQGKTNLRIHMRTHTGEKPFQCLICYASFTQSGSLHKHKSKHTNEHKHCCVVCSKKFRSKYGVKKHMVIHSMDRPYSCSICHLKFKTKNSLQQHFKIIHNRATQYICDYCGYSTTVKPYLATHIKNYHSATSGFCKKCTKNVTNLQTHITQKHSKQKKFQCEYCANTFGELVALKKHIIFKHRVDDKFKCSQKGCVMTFPANHMLQYHIDRFHKQKANYQCDECPRSFYRKSDLTKHVDGSHGVAKLQCDKCPRIFHRKSDIIRHILCHK